MSRGLRMGSEVGHVAGKLAVALGCSSCGIGIAVDMVGKRWGEEPYDWKGERFNPPHACAVTAAGLSPDQMRTVGEIEKELETWSHRQHGGGGEYQVPLPDARLPVERDEPETNA